VRFAREVGPVVVDQSGLYDSVTDTRFYGKTPVHNSDEGLIDMRPTKPWMFNVLDIYDYQQNTGGWRDYFSFIRNSVPLLKGDLLEFGVFRGRSLLATALLLDDLNLSRRVWGFDSFAGFPSTDELDEFSQFERLAYEGKISSSHIEDVRRNREYLGVVGRTATPTGASTSGAFEATSEELVRRKIEYLNLDGLINLVVGDFTSTLSELSNGPLESIAGALIDCDLYQGYKAALSFCWPRLEVGGMIFLDEYFSLKFPGPRIATDEFCKRNSIEPILLLQEDGWERWALVKQ